MMISDVQDNGYNEVEANRDVNQYNKALMMTVMGLLRA